MRAVCTECELIFPALDISCESIFVQEIKSTTVMRKDMHTGTAKITQSLSTLNLFLKCRRTADEACHFPYLFHSILLRGNWYKRLVYPDVLIRSESNGSKTHVKMDKFLKKKMHKWCRSGEKASWKQNAKNVCDWTDFRPQTTNL